MAYTTLEILADAVRADLERHCDGRPARRAEHLRDLLHLLLTAEVPQRLAGLAAAGEIRGLPTHLHRLQRHLHESSGLPEALCARYRYKASEAEARRRYKVRRRSWRYVHNLAAEIDWDPAVHVPRLPYRRYAWHDALEERYVELEVVLDPQALEAMLIPALEAYHSPRGRRRKGYEVYGINLGMSREQQRRRSGGLRVTRYVSVLRSQPQLSAEADYGFVEPNPRSLDAILQATRALYPQYQAVGDFHSHPYDDFARLEAKRGWEYTASDERSNIELEQVLAEMGEPISVSFVLAVARSNQAVARTHYRGRKNTYQVALGNCRVILGAYRSLGTGRLTQTNIRLRLAGAAG